MKVLTDYQREVSEKLNDRMADITREAGYLSPTSSQCDKASLNETLNRIISLEDYLSKISKENFPSVEKNVLETYYKSSQKSTEDKTEFSVYLWGEDYKIKSISDPESSFLSVTKDSVKKFIEEDIEEQKTSVEEKIKQYTLPIKKETLNQYLDQFTEKGFTFTHGGRFGGSHPEKDLNLLLPKVFSEEYVAEVKQKIADAYTKLINKYGLIDEVPVKTN